MKITTIRTLLEAIQALETKDVAEFSRAETARKLRALLDDEGFDVSEQNRTKIFFAVSHDGTRTVTL